MTKVVAGSQLSAFLSHYQPSKSSKNITNHRKPLVNIIKPKPLLSTIIDHQIDHSQPPLASAYRRRPGLGTCGEASWTTWRWPSTWRDYPQRQPCGLLPQVCGWVPEGLTTKHQLLGIQDWSYMMVWTLKMNTTLSIIDDYWWLTRIIMTIIWIILSFIEDYWPGLISINH